MSRDRHRQVVHARVRTRVEGTSERPRLCVYRSLSHIYAQVVDDRSGRTLVSASSLDKDTKKQLKAGGNVAAAKEVSKDIGERPKAAKIGKDDFERGRYKNHDRDKSTADADREVGLQF